MPRRPRLDLPGIPQHIVQRGNNRSPCFFADDDRYAYLHRLRRHAAKLTIEIHAYVLMSNHVHLLVTPQRVGDVSTLMREFGHEYVQLVNAAHRRSGTLWEGRFYSCLVDSERYVLTCMRYIELNPIRAGMVATPEDYRWSSFRSNAFGRPDSTLTPHAAYRALGTGARECCRVYRELFARALDTEDVQALRQHTRQRAAWGSEGFQREIARRVGRAVAAFPPGRPKRADLTGSDPINEALKTGQI